MAAHVQQDVNKKYVNKSDPNNKLSNFYSIPSRTVQPLYLSEHKENDIDGLRKYFPRRKITERKGRQTESREH